MADITRIRSMTNMGVLLDKGARDEIPQFRRYNLVYGFNGSGKSTLSRAFACLQGATAVGSMPENCGFEFELTDKTVLSYPDHPGGLEATVCVFNTDFVERNLRWANGTAESIFYISQEQADAAEELARAEADLPVKAAAVSAADTTFKARDQALGSLKKSQARLIASKLHQTGRKYEAPNLKSDYAEFKRDAAAALSADRLADFEEVASRSSPPPKADTLSEPDAAIESIVETARRDAAASVGASMIAELTEHPAMVPWARSGFEYHSGHHLNDCLFCGQPITQARKQALAAAFNDALSGFIANLQVSEGRANSAINRVELSLVNAAELSVMPELKPQLQAAVASLREAVPALREIFDAIKGIYAARRSAPTVAVEAPFAANEVVLRIFETVSQCVEKVNGVVRSHNEAVAEFGRHQKAARDAITQHFLLEGFGDYHAALNAVDMSQNELTSASDALQGLRDRIAELRARVRTHGAAAATISRLIRAYLGHGELTIVPAEVGYELHRHGKPVRGQPSEGEKTAIALCYFLSLLRADGRRLEDVIVVVDDPISSLDTKAMTYACALIWGGLRGAKQVFVLTHNQHCMNEFKKFWLGLAYPKNPKTEPSGSLLYLDVSTPKGGTLRKASLIEMPKFLRAYDSEYHFLCSKVLEFEKAGNGYYGYGYLMPHLLRRVLESFLAFKQPGTHPIAQKLETLVKLHADKLDAPRISALERLCQLESHSENMDDFTSHSSMTIEESRDANIALLELMRVADENHTKAIREQCQAA